MESSPQFIANHKALQDDWKKAKIETMVLLLRGAYAARDKVGLKMNLPENKLAELLKTLPSLRNPTVAHLAGNEWVAVETIIDESVVREIIPQLKALGAEGIIEYPLNKVVY
jgi:ATP phosphoribosyltransferase